MTSDKELVQYIADRMAGAGEIRYRMMFGMVGEGQLFVKITEAGGRVCPNLPRVPPYEGAKPYFLVEDVDDGERLTELVAATCAELSEPKKRR